MLTKAFEAILLLTPWVTILAILLLAIRRWLLPRQPASGALRLAWLALAVRCALPVRLALPVPARPTPPAWSAPVLLRPEGASGLPTALEPTVAVNAASAAGLSPAALLPVLWALGALCFVTVQLARHLAFCRRLCQGRERLPLPGRVYRSAGARVPVTVGLLRPAVYLPVSLAPDDLPFVLAHERRHIRAGDLWFQLILLAAQSLHWFNPLVHRMALTARQDMEMACDAAVLRGKPLACRLRYGETVLTALKTARRQAVLSAPLCGPGRAAQTRFKEMLDMRTPKKSLLVLPALLCAAVLACSLFTACAVPVDRPASTNAVSEAFATESGSASSPAAVPESLSVPDAGSAAATFAPDSSSAVSAPKPDGSAEPETVQTDTGFVWPVSDSAEMSRVFGVAHKGIDIPGEYETPIYAIQDGAVRIAGSGEDYWGYGVCVRIDHSDGLQSLYAHLAGVAVEKGDTVKKGDLIGYMGSTGRSTGIHLHLEISRNGTVFDPLELLPDPPAGAADSSANSGTAG